jgi:hypothetical protein
VAGQSPVGQHRDGAGQGLGGGQAAGVLDDDVAGPDQLGHVVHPAQHVAVTGRDKTATQGLVAAADDHRGRQPGRGEVGGGLLDLADTPRAGHDEGEPDTGRQVEGGP